LAAKAICLHHPGSESTDQELSDANYPNIRLLFLYLPKVSLLSLKSVGLPNGGLFNAIGRLFFCGGLFLREKNLQAKIQRSHWFRVESAYGGTPIEAWISPEGRKRPSNSRPKPHHWRDRIGIKLMTVLVVDFNKWIDTIERKDLDLQMRHTIGARLCIQECVSQLPAYFERNQDKALKKKTGWNLWFLKRWYLTKMGLKPEFLSYGPVIDDDLSTFS